MATARLFVARHCERAAFARDGHFDLELCHQEQAGKRRFWNDALTGEGTRQAVALSRDLPVGSVRRIVASDWLRCVQTASIVARELGLTEIELDPALGEHEREAWFGETGSRPGHLTHSLPELQDFVDATLGPNGQRILLKPHAQPFPDPRRATDAWEVGEARTAAVAQAILTAGVKTFGHTLLVTHGGVGQRTVEALTGDFPGGADFAAWCAVELREEPRTDSNEAVTTASLVRKFGAPLSVTPDQRWADPHLANWRKWFGPEGARLGLDGPARVLELGSWEGLSMSMWLKELVSMHPESCLVCIDHFDDMQTEAGQLRRQRLHANTRCLTQHYKIRVVPRFTLPALMDALHDFNGWHGDGPAIDEGFDLVYVDADHAAHSTLLDALLAWRLLRKGGYLLFDDYEWPTRSPKDPHNPPSQEHPDHPKAGIEAFLALSEHELEVVSRGYQVLVRKTGGQVDTGFISPQSSVVPVAAVVDAETWPSVATDLKELATKASASKRQLDILLLYAQSDVHQSVDEQPGAAWQQKMTEALPVELQRTWLPVPLGSVPLQGAERRAHVGLHLSQVCPGRVAEALFLLPNAVRDSTWASEVLRLWRQRPVEGTVACAAPDRLGAVVLRPHRLARSTVALTLVHESIEAQRAGGWLGVVRRALPETEFVECEPSSA
ncbi:uncharacterized protein MONBRDRAFT_35580 [Monosiga brevicollis MX1]|uniref:Uncharacterized protein n=1 Tax=Monosiga brevicollis TaxID=81824 RepID=A9UQ18_MONBE|nr:uncharacterized protein MONBRDRAFT_35580 [Monosiga brevicollis MX1]EDQ92519.1 predicted protein [Monosiga brevicollis MX1]|eukprot:XP_001742281.1 hypothetical protein [Monosiga brevicollis MX1]